MATGTDGIPKSRITLTYRTDVHGEPEDVTLPFRLLLMGDLSGGTSADRRVQDENGEWQATDLDARPIRNLDGTNLNSVMQDMKMSLKLEGVANTIGGGTFDFEMPVDSMKSFAPAEVAKHIPHVKALLLLKELLREVQGDLDNRKTFRNLVRDLNKALRSSDEGARAAAQKFVEQLKGLGLHNIELPDAQDEAAGADAE
ncbi:MAG: type VI secretion system contractile sheath small subunit [Myxococcales bacterium]|nr:type VI secretion system contractile sheath small subunit [Myxococcales bacterium]MDD9966918.1 type VI secretion system contractile sheath small subunit [Myxococcales bacterium]